jgi:hypothetical protein
VIGSKVRVRSGWAPRKFDHGTNYTQKLVKIAHSALTAYWEAKFIPSSLVTVTLNIGSPLNASQSARA